MFRTVFFLVLFSFFSFFFFHDTATTEIYTLSLHDALPICPSVSLCLCVSVAYIDSAEVFDHHQRSEEHTSELQSLRHLVCRLLLEKKKKEIIVTTEIKYTYSTV